MARRRQTNPHEVQAKASLVLAVIGGGSALALIFMVFRCFDFEEFAAQYIVGSSRYYAILAAAALGMATGGIGFFVSLNSAGQKRNKLSNLAWAAFFVNTFVVTLTLCIFITFWFARDPIFPMSP